MEPIDAVISWVDGYDPIYQQKLTSFCKEQGVDKHRVIEPTRIQQNNEIHFCLHSLRRFTPWLRTIYIITNQQIPPVVMDLQDSAFGKKIKIIDQNELLQQFNSTMPVFNRLSIEWLIWHIEGLSNEFLYLNDDFFIIRDMTRNDFFNANRLVLRGEWKVQTAKKWRYQAKKYFNQWVRGSEELTPTNPHRAWQEKSAQLTGFNKKFYLLPHAPFPLRKTTYEEYIKDKPELFAENIRYPFRHPAQVSSIPLMVHLDIQSNRVDYDTYYKSIMVNGAIHSLKKIQSHLNLAKNKRYAFVCMQSIDQAPSETQAFMINWLQKTITD